MRVYKAFYHIVPALYQVVHRMIKHPLANVGIERFLADRASGPNKK